MHTLLNTTVNEGIIMAQKICTAGVVGSLSFVVLKQDTGVISSIRYEENEILTYHDDINQATEWTDRKLIHMIGKQYETD